MYSFLFSVVFLGLLISHFYTVKFMIFSNRAEINAVSQGIERAARLLGK